MAYDIQTDALYAPLELIEAGKLADDCAEKWWRSSDELFFVLDGTLLLDIEGAGGEARSYELGPRQAMMVPRGVVHRTRSPKRSVVLMIEAATVVPTGD